MAINFKRGLLSDMLQDEQFLVAAGLLSAGSQGQGIGQAAFPAMLQAAQIQKAFAPKINKTKAAVDTTIDTSTGESNLVFVSDKQIAENPSRFIPQEKKGNTTNIKNVLGDKYETQYDKDRGAADAKYIGDLNEKAATAQENIGRYDLVSVLSKNVNSGAFGEQLLSLAKAGKRLGINTDWITRTDANGNVGLRDGVASAETLEVLQVQFTLDKTQKTKGAISDREFQTFSQTSPGLSMTPEGIQMLSTVNKNLAQRDIEVAELANQWEADYGRLKNKGETQYGNLSFQQFLNKWKEDNPVVNKEFLEDMRKLSNEGSGLYGEKQVYTIGGVQYRKLKDGTVIRIGAL